MQVRHGVVLLALVGACKKEQPEPTAKPEPKAAAASATEKPRYDALARVDFNRRAQELFLPLFWRADKNDNRALDADELAVLWGPHGKKQSDYVAGGAFTPEFAKAYAQLSAPVDLGKLEPTEKARQEQVLLELSQGRPTLVENDFAGASTEDKAIVAHVLKAAEFIEAIHAKQLGTHALEAKVPEVDAASRSLFYRNQGPWCVAPKTENNPACNAVPGTPPARVSGLYPADIQADQGFCAMLEKQKNAKELMGHFSVVEADGKGGFRAVPYSEAYKDEMQAVAKELEAAAAAVSSPDEKAFQTYLTATAQAFRTNDWEPANEAWAAMGVNNSKWYLRIAPDEVYYEPCAWKAGFAVNFSRINKDSLTWQQKLEPRKQELEEILAKFAGPPYKARKVNFKLPDFIDIIVNAGDQRNAHGATVGQSLPNWGKVAEKGGRTVAMTNLYTDFDSQQALRAQAASLFCKATQEKLSTESAPGVMSTVLHEAAHNLGPSHEYKVKGKVDDEVFGGPLAATMEELKAQSAALFFTGWLADQGVITQAEAEAAHVREVTWAFGHVSRGMYDAAGKPRHYSQLAAIQLGTLRAKGALVWKQDEKAANGADVGCFELDLEKWKPAVEELAHRVLRAKGRGDKKDAEKLKADFVDAKDEWQALRGTIQERWLRAPKATFVYSVGT